MTYTEAKKEIDSRIELARKHYPEVPDYIEALEMASEALERQTPEKPTYDHYYGEMGCAFCGEMVSGWEEVPDYCPHCGQAIDWSKE